MREIKSEAITEAIARLCVQANRALPASLEDCIRNANETRPVSRPVMEDLCRNLDAARELGLTLCAGGTQGTIPPLSSMSALCPGTSSL